MTPRLLFVRKIEVIECRYLKNILVIQDKGVLLKYWRNFQSLPTVGLMAVEIKSKVDNQSRLYTTTLTALLAEPFYPDDRHLALRLTTVDGIQFLVGTDEPPYPVINTMLTLAAKPSDQTGCTLSVEYTDRFGFLPVLD